LNGLDELEAWRDVGLLIGGSASLPVIQHVTSACHHCLEPACMNACPVEAYEKDPITGIVRHLDDQCIGCQYCTLACPYDVPKYHPGKGIVRKCDMCSDRLREGEAPACVQACPHEAIRIRVVDVEDVRERAQAGEFLPGAYDPSLTMPTTVFRSVQPGELHPGDGRRPQPQHAHLPLTLMLVLTQLSVGGFLIELAARLSGRADGVCGVAFLVASLSLGFVGLAASLAHLGRPQYAYRAILGIRHSWLSREVVALGLFAKLAAAFVAVEVAMTVPIALPFGLRLDLSVNQRIMMLIAVVAAGALGVGCSVMVYHAVRRPFWHASIAGWKFAGTSLVLGLATSLACLGVAIVVPLGSTADRGAGLLPAVAFALALAVVAKLAFEARDLRETAEGPLGQTAWLLRGPLKRLVKVRYLLGVVGGLALPAVAATASFAGMPVAAGLLAVGSLVLVLAGEFIERYLFFTAVTKPMMPGGLPS
jgi:Fe-S-cluster-containing dehydrogenase component/DMSO reductase anchor subunit